MMKKIFLAVVLLFLPHISYGADLSSTTCPGSGCVDFNVSGYGTIGIQITGTWSGTITFQGTVDGTNFVDLRVVSASDTGSAGTTTTVANGVFNATVAGLRNVRVEFSVYSSGTATVTMRVTQVAAKFGTGSATSNVTPPPTSNPASPNFLVDGGQVIWTSAYTFNISAAQYVIQGTTYNSAEQSITLTTADPTNPRIDIIALNSSAAVVAIAGTAAATPSTPTYDPGTQLPLSYVSVPANSTQPAGVTTATLYADNAGSYPGQKQEANRLLESIR